MVGDLHSPLRSHPAGPPLASTSSETGTPTPCPRNPDTFRALLGLGLGEVLGLGHIRL